MREGGYVQRGFRSRVVRILDRARTEILPSPRDAVDSAGPGRVCTAAGLPLVGFELAAARNVFFLLAQNGSCGQMMSAQPLHRAVRAKKKNLGYVITIRPANAVLYPHS